MTQLRDCFHPDSPDAYELLRRAKNIIEQYEVEDGEQWLEGFRNLPGAELSEHQIRVLRDPFRRCMHNKSVVDELLEMGYLMKVSHVRGPGRASIQIRVNKKGKEAIRLRGDVV